MRGGPTGPDRRLTRRAALRVAAAAVLMPAASGCAALHALWPTGTRSAPPPVEVVLLGLPGDAQLQAILQGWPGVQAHVATADGPDAWLCPGQAWRTPAPFGFGVVTPIRGRTLLGFPYGTATPPLPSTPRRPPPAPDVIVTTTLWLYWIAELLADLTDALQHQDRQSSLAGVPQTVLDQGVVFSPGRGSFRAVLPLLRNPVGLSLAVSGPLGSAPLAAPDAPAPWRWSDLMAMLQSSGAPVVDASAFVSAGGRPDAAELAAAVAVAYGGAFGAPPAMDHAPAVDGWTEVLPLLAARGLDSRGGASVLAGHILSPYRPSGDLPAGLTNAGPWWRTPVPAGPEGRATPVAHVVAGMPAAAAHPTAGADFLVSLASAEGQARLRPWNGGLLLRPADALAQLAADHPEVERPHDWVDASADLTPARLWGAALTDPSASAAYAGADALAAAMPLLRGAHAQADIWRVADGMQRDLPARGSALPPLRIGRCG